MKPKKPIESLILNLRNQKVILDADLAELYGVPTKVFNQAAKRNSDRFPADFAFQLTAAEVVNLRSQFVTSSVQSIDVQKDAPNSSQIATSSYGGRRYRPWAFTEHGAIMAATVLNSPEAVAMSVFVVRAFMQSYEPSWLYEGGFQFRKHYFGPKPGELLETTPSGKLKEEFQCAQFLDGLPEVKFWVRNLANKATSFRLQTSKNWFYPDFLCQLNDGRALVVEYKGEHLFAEAEEKRAVGKVWGSRSGGKCLFVMPEGKDLERIRFKISGK